MQKWPDGHKRDWLALHARRDKEWRRQWRVLLKTVQMKMEAALDDASDFDAEMLPYLLLPNGQTFAEQYAPQVEQLYASGEAPQPLARLLPAPKEGAG